MIKELIIGIMLFTGVNARAGATPVLDELRYQQDFARKKQVYAEFESFLMKKRLAHAKRTSKAIAKAIKVETHKERAISALVESERIASNYGLSSRSFNGFPDMANTSVHAQLTEQEMVLDLDNYRPREGS